MRVSAESPTTCGKPQDLVGAPPVPKAYPEGPSTQIVRFYFRSQKPYSEWFLDLETLLFGYLDPLGYGFLGNSLV